jgi:hypothetical protein
MVIVFRKHTDAGQHPKDSVQCIGMGFGFSRKFFGSFRPIAQ